MPIFPSKSKKSMSKDPMPKAESLPVALGVQRKNKAKAPKMMADGGQVSSDRKSIADQIGSPFGPQHPQPDPTPKPMAEGGIVEDSSISHRDVADAIIAKRRMDMAEDNQDAALHEDDDEAMTDLHDEPSEDESPKDMVSILRDRIKSRRGV